MSRTRGSSFTTPYYAADKTGRENELITGPALPPIPAPPASLLQPVRRVTISTCGRAPLLGRSCVRKAGSKWRRYTHLGETEFGGIKIS